MTGRFIQARAATGVARLGAHQLGHLIASLLAFGIAIAAFDVVQNAFEWMLLLDLGAAIVDVAEIDFGFASSVQDVLLLLIS